MKPLLIDERFGYEGSIFIDPKTINLVQLRRVTMVIKTEPVEAENENQTQEVQENEQRIDGYELQVFTKYSPRGRFKFFAENPDLEWLEKNCQTIGLSKVQQDESGTTYLNKENIIDINLTINEQANMSIHFYSPLSYLDEMELKEHGVTITDNERGYEHVLVYNVSFDVDERLKGERPYSIMTDFLDRLG